MKSKQIQEAAGVSRLQVVRWVDAGVLIPLEDAKGRGGRREFSQRNIREAALAGALHKRGIGLGTIKEIMGFLRRSPDWLEKEDLALRERYGRDDYLSLFARDLYKNAGEVDEEAEGASRFLETLRAYQDGRIKSWWDLVQLQRQGIVAVFDLDDQLSFTLTYQGLLGELFDGEQYPDAEVVILIDVHRIIKRVG